MKNIKIIPLFTITAILLTSCAGSGSRTEENVQQIENIGEDSGSNTDSNRITRKLADNLEIDAEVIYPSENELAVYSVRRKIFDADSIRLFIGADRYTMEENPNYENSFTADTAEGSSLLVSEGYFSYIKNRERDEDVVSLIEDFLLKADDTGTVGELPFMNKKEAIALGKERIKELSGDSAEVIRIVAMGNEELEKLQNNLLDEDSYQAGIDNGKANMLDSFTGDDDVYYIQYAVKQDDIYLYDGITEPQISLAIDAFWDFSVNITVLIGKDGIRYFNYRNAFGEPVMEKEKESIITADEVLHNIEKVYDGIILTGPVTITKLWIEYVPVPDWEDLAQIELRPYWCVRINSIDKEGENWSSAERINALTGGSLSYGE